MASGAIINFNLYAMGAFLPAFLTRVHGLSVAQSGFWLGIGHVLAGVLAANANNNTLVAGMDWQCRILPEKVLDNMNFGLYSWWAQATYDATDAGAKVICLSAGGTSTSTRARSAAPPSLRYFLIRLRAAIMRHSLIWPSLDIPRIPVTQYHVPVIEFK